MTRAELKNYVEQGREIEFEYNEKKYSITYVPHDVKDYISFCEFYKETTEVCSVDELEKVERDGITVMQMLEHLPKEKIWVF